MVFTLLKRYMKRWKSSEGLLFKEIQEQNCRNPGTLEACPDLPAMLELVFRMALAACKVWVVLLWQFEKLSLVIQYVQSTRHAPQRQGYSRKDCSSTWPSPLAKDVSLFKREEASRLEKDTSISPRDMVYYWRGPLPNATDWRCGSHPILVSVHAGWPSRPSEVARSCQERWLSTSLLPLLRWEGIHKGAGGGARPLHTGQRFLTWDLPAWLYIQPET